mmetsp:Transcript_6794/g.11430  ORF Transcript_6794/g.11430 Transcript_6794/m.11430 type:complete len:250 (+) Transcript_6794:206-955(+)
MPIFNQNLRKIHDIELELTMKRQIIVELANQFLIYIAVIEHPLNNFEAMDQNLIDEVIKPNVIEAIKDDIQEIFLSIEQLFQKIQKLLDLMRQNYQDQQLFDSMHVQLTPLFKEVKDLSNETRTQLERIQKIWFLALDQQEEAEALADKIEGKVDKITQMQSTISDLIDEISINIQQHDSVPEVDGVNQDYVIQSQIIAVNGLLEQVDRLKDKIEGNESDGGENPYRESFLGMNELLGRGGSSAETSPF